MAQQSEKSGAYRLSDQVGFNLRRANQRHVALFSRLVEEVTPTQFATLARLFEHGALSQNKLGRLTSMDSATIKGVVERLRLKGLVETRPDPNDQRRRLVDLTPDGLACYENAHLQALEARRETLEPLTKAEAAQFEALLAKLV